MSEPITLLQLSGADMEPAKLENSHLIIIDMQNEYLHDPLKIDAADQAIASAEKLLTKARQVGTSIIHIAHQGRAGSLFNRDTPRGEIVEALVPQEKETVIEKKLPNAFAGTMLAEILSEAGAKDLIIIGFMTHMCVSSTARAALDLGYRVTIDADSCGTRDLPDGCGGIIDAKTLNNVALVELSDRFAVIARNHDWQ